MKRRRRVNADTQQTLTFPFPFPSFLWGQRQTGYCGDARAGGRGRFPPTRLLVDLLAPEAEVDGGGGGEQDDGQDDPPQTLV